MFRRAGVVNAGDPSWPLSQGVSLVAGGTRTNTRFYNGHNPPALLSSTPGTGTTGTTAYSYSMDPLGRFYIERVSATSAVLGWRNAGTWSRQTITVPTFANIAYYQPAVSLDGTRLYFRTDAGISEWSLNAATRTATKVVDASFGAPATGFTNATGIKWVSADTLLLEYQHPTSYLNGVRLVRKVAGTWVSLDTVVDTVDFINPSSAYDVGPLYVRQLSASASELRYVKDNLSGPILISAQGAGVFPVQARTGLDRTHAYVWYVSGDSLFVTRVSREGGTFAQFSIATGLTGPSLTDIHPLDGGLVLVNTTTTWRMFRCTAGGITAYTAGTAAVTPDFYGRFLGEPIA